MSARIVDIARVKNSLAARVQESLPGVLTHWENQNQPPPASDPYVSLLISAGPAMVSITEERFTEVIESVDFVVPDPLPAVGVELRIRMDWSVARYVIAGGEMVADVRDDLLGQMNDFPEVSFGLYTFASVGADTIAATASELGGIIETTVGGGIVEENKILVDAWRKSGAMQFTVRYTIYGLSSVSATDLSALGRNSPESLWSTLQLKMQQQWPYQDRLLQDGVSTWSLWPSGSAIPTNLGAGIEPRMSGSVVYSTKGVNFEEPPETLREIRGTVSASAPGSAASTTVDIVATQS